MDNVTLCHSLIKWLKTFPGHANVTSSNLTDGVAMGKILNQIAPEYFDANWLSKIKTDVGENWRLKVSNLRKVHQGVMDYYSDSVGQSVAHYAPPDLNKIGEFGDEAELGGLLQLILGCAINCEQKQRHIEAIMMMEESVQSVIVNAIQDLLNREGSPGVAEASLGPASFHPQVRNLMDQLESTSSAKEDLSRRCNEMDLQISLLNEEKSNLKGENERLIERVEILESGGDIGAQAMRYKELKKQVDTLQDDLFKIETSRDDYRSRVEGLEASNVELSTKNEELQTLADEARTLKDEVDALRDMSERVAVYEGTVETYKKKLEELSDLRRQVKILEDKNSDYMHHNMELEEEVKKSFTWRPQLDLYKKQVSDLHQKLSDEAKKTDRQIFENKKTKERLDTIVQEKDRIMLERDHLKETLEDLKCTVSAFQSPDSSSRPPSDLSGMDTLEIIPQEIREKLFRLQHENKVLKGRVNERSEEANPLLQSMLNDLQERHDRLSKENRFEASSLSYSFGNNFNRFKMLKLLSSPLDEFNTFTPTNKTGHNSFDKNLRMNKLRVFKRNLKWASESDLLVLRRPNEIFAGVLSSTNSISSTSSVNSTSALNQKYHTLPPQSSSHSPKSNQSKSPLVIRHIHEFRLPPSPTNEDSGCYGTSPSSSPDYGGTLDSGVSGLDHSLSMSRTGSFRTDSGPDSGFSGYHRCISPLIPSIVEECTNHHISDIIPSLTGNETKEAPNPLVYHHSHKANTVGRNSSHCRCRSPKRTEGELARFLESSHCRCNNSDACIHVCKFHSLPHGCHQNFAYSKNSLKSNESKQCSHLANNSCMCKQVVSQNSKSNFNNRVNLPSSPTPHNSPRLPHTVHLHRTKAKPFLQTHFPCDKGSSSEEHSAGTENDSLERKGRRGLSRDRGGSTRSSEVLCMTNDDEGTKLTERTPLKEADISKACSKRRSKSLDKVRSRRDRRASMNSSEKKIECEKKDMEMSERLSDMESNFLKCKLAIEENRVQNGDIRKQLNDLEFQRSSNKEKLTGCFPSDSSLNRFRNSFRQIGKGTFLSNGNKNLKQMHPASDENISYDPSSNKNLPKPRLTRSSSLRIPNSKKGSYLSPFSDQRDDTIVGMHTMHNIQVPTTDNRLQSSSQPNVYPLKGCLKYNNGPNGIGKPLRSISVDASNTVPLNVKIEIPSDNLQKHHKPRAKSADVTVLTDTLFTHFMVSPSENTLRSNSSKNGKDFFQTSAMMRPVGNNFGLPRFPKEGDPLLSDTDTDIELIENRLVSSAYGAPLVSAESSTSFSQIEKPFKANRNSSGSEFELNPRQFKLIDDMGARLNANKENAILVSSIIANDDDENYALTRSNSFFKRKKKVAIDNKARPYNVKGGIVKVKNKTAKAVVAETFNAMFTFCTP